MLMKEAAPPDIKPGEDKSPDTAMAGHAMQHSPGEMPSRKQGGGMAHDMSDPAMAASMEADIRLRFWVALALSVVIVLLSPMGKAHGLTLPFGPAARSWVLFALTTPVVFWCGWMFISGAYQALRSRKLDMSVLIAVGVLAAYLASVYLTVIGSADLFYEAAAMLVTFVLFGHWMEMKSRRGTSDALQALFKLVPPKARVIRGGAETEVPTAEVVQGDLLALRPGDRIPVDGEITEGETAVDEALITGESLPVEKKPGDAVIAGSINGTGAVTFKATGVGAETTLARIAKLVETAQNSKAPGQRLADKAAAYLVVVAVSVGVITFVSWRYGAGASFLTALTFAISALVIACPDALGLATPTAVAVGTGLGAKHNILIKDAATLEGASRITAVALDKTGTLTEGKPRLTDIAVATGTTEEEALRLLAAVERGSSHPLALAILEEAKKRNLTLPEKIEGFENVAGHGLKAIVEGKPVLVGNARLLTDAGIDLTPVQARLDELMAAGRTVILLAVEKKAVAVVGVSDPIKPSAKRAVAELKKLGIQTALISGDNKVVAEAVGKEVGIDRVFAEVLPEDKAKYVQQLQGEGKFVAMVGDGVNDAPALAQADIGIAMGKATDVAMAAADITLLRADLNGVADAILLSRRTMKIIRQNLFWAFIFNVIGIPLAALGLLNPMLAALAMAFSSVTVVTNSLRLKTARL